MPLQPPIPIDQLTRHAVCVGMTGSGKTGLCVTLLESLAAAGIPLLVIDPKGDLANLALVFARLMPEAFAAWCPDPEAACAAWRQGLAAEGMGEADLIAWLARVGVSVLTPGSEAGIPIDVLSAVSQLPTSLAGDDEGTREYVTGCVAALLGLIGVESDPVTDPATILLARLLTDAFEAGRAMPVERLIPAIVDPPFSQLGMFPLDAYFPRERRMELAHRLNGVIASPAFAGWRKGIPLDVAAWLAPLPDGRVPVRVVYLAHLDDRQRMFFVTLLLHAVVGWSRKLSGSENLRALVYFDEVMGYLPPHPANPPSKAPVLTLMKQARSVGVGIMLCTQNPVDVDYKALSNALTWMIGRLQTKQDRLRVLDGLGGEDTDRAAYDQALTTLQKRHFLLRDGGPVRTIVARHALAFLRGPLTRAEVARLGQTWAGTTPSGSPWLTAPPPLPDGLPARWLTPEGHAALGLEAPSTEAVWRPALYARFAMRFDDGAYQADEEVHRLMWPADQADGAVSSTRIEDGWLLREPADEGHYSPAPPWLATASDVVKWKSGWVSDVRLEVSHDGPDGPLSAEKDDIRVIGVAVVWVATR